jgi:hypothetical protein
MYLLQQLRYLPQIVVPATLVLLIAGIVIQRWINRQLASAELRKASRTWSTMTITSSPWPEAGQAGLHFFGVDEVTYDPEADAIVFIDAKWAEIEEFIATMRAS